MGIISFEISESDYSKKLTSNYELSILCRVDSFVYMVTNDQGRVLLLRDYRLDTPFQKDSQRAEELRHTLARDAHLQSSFAQVRIGLVSALHTMVPNRLFNPREKEAYLRQLTPLKEDWEVKSDDLNSTPAQNVYAYPSSVLSVLAERFKGARICHSGSAILLAHRSLPEFAVGTQVFVNVWPKQLQVIVFEEGELQFMNTFAYHSSQDFIYFVLLVFDQYELDRQKAIFQLAGQIVEGSEIFRLLKRYLGRVQLRSIPSFLKLGKGYGEVPPHLYYDLFCLVRCP